MSQELLESVLAAQDPDSRHNRFSIELDCPPGNPRPNDLFPGVLKDTGLEVDDFENVSRVFGNFMWILKAEAGKDDLFMKHKETTFKERITALYRRHTIRYGSW